MSVHMSNHMCVDHVWHACSIRQICMLGFGCRYPRTVIALRESEVYSLTLDNVREVSTHARTHAHMHAHMHASMHRQLKNFFPTDCALVRDAAAREVFKTIDVDGCGGGNTHTCTAPHRTAPHERAPHAHTYTRANISTSTSTSTCAQLRACKYVRTSMHNNA